jgi:hypothetical protein
MMHKSPTIDTLNTQIRANFTPNVPVDRDRYVDFFTKPVNAVTKS